MDGVLRGLLLPSLFLYMHFWRFGSLLSRFLQGYGYGYGSGNRQNRRSNNFLFELDTTTP